MFKDSIPGLDKLFKNDVERPKVVLVTGPPGSMKTTFCYTLMSNYLRDKNEFGLYSTLEETVDSHLQNMESVGVKLSMKMQVSDLTDLREIDQIDEVIGQEAQTDYVLFIEKMIQRFKRTHGNKFSIFVLDSLGALYSLMENVSDMRKKMFYFFKMLRDNNLTSFIIMERSITGESQLLGNEGFLADGILLLGLDRQRGKLVRFLQVEKMRAAEHSMERHAIEVGRSGIQLLGPIMSAP
ncbi:MAG: AAA family ATPase [Candidatus Thermoplasmatota archaeon]|nr:AAA family ATPase [Candidatus Thermoplasmatota archaeon]